MTSSSLSTTYKPAVLDMYAPRIVEDRVDILEQLVQAGASINVQVNRQCATEYIICITHAYRCTRECVVNLFRYEASCLSKH